MRMLCWHFYALQSRVLVINTVFLPFFYRNSTDQSIFTYTLVSTIYKMFTFVLQLLLNIIQNNYEITME